MHSDSLYVFVFKKTDCMKRLTLTGLALFIEANREDAAKKMKRSSLLSKENVFLQNVNKRIE